MKETEIFRSEYDESIILTPQENSWYIVMTVKDQEGTISEICVDKRELIKSFKEAIKLMEV